MEQKIIFKSETVQEKDQMNYKTTTQEGRNITVDIPKEFSGPGNFLSPEDLYLSSVVNCFIATFNVISKKSNFEFRDIRTINELHVQKNEEGKLVCDTINIQISITCTNKEKLESIINLTKKNCIIHNSIKTKINIILA